MIPGIDVSHWQYEINWSEVKRSGVQFAFIKATEFPDKKTELFIDNKLEDNKQGASEYGIHWGAYHYFRTHIDPITQAKAFCETVGSFPSLPPVIDLEVSGLKGERLNHKVQQFLQEVEQITGRVPIIYTSGGFWRSYMTYEKQSHTDWARKYPLWVAHYTLHWPAPLYPWAGWDFWQYANTGRIPGIKTDVDLNWFIGSIDDLTKNFLHGNRQANPQPVVIDLEEQTKPNSKSMSRFYCERKEIDELEMPVKGSYPKYTPMQEAWVRSYYMDNQ